MESRLTRNQTELNDLEPPKKRQKRSQSQENQIKQEHLTELIVARKGLIVRFVLPLLDLNTKLTILPLVSKRIRHFVTSPTHDRHFFNLIYSDVVSYVDGLT